MDTSRHSAASEAPAFKIARVGKKRRRKGGGLALFRGGATTSGWSGAAASGGMAAGKVLTCALVAALGAGAVGLGAALGGKPKNAVPAPKPKAFSTLKDVKIEGDTSNLPATEAAIPNSMGYVSGSIDGLTPEERAKEAAEARRKADEEARKAGAAAGAASAAPNPAQLLAAARADGGKPGGLAKKYGQLSSSAGGGSSLSGGAGLSGGMNRSFSAMPLKGNVGGTSAMKGGAKASVAGAGKSAAAHSSARGFARRQAFVANALSRRGAQASRAETASYDAGTAFDNNAGAGNVIAGAGSGTAAKPAAAGANAGAAEGGPLSGGETPQCVGTQIPDPTSGECKDISAPPAQDETPWKTVLDIAQGLMTLVSVLAGLAFAFAGKAWLEAYAEIIAKIMTAVGVVLAGLGGLIMLMGGYWSGAVVSAVGAFVIVHSVSAFGTAPLTLGSTVVTMAAGLLLGQMADGMDRSRWEENQKEAAG